MLPFAEAGQLVLQPDTFGYCRRFVELPAQFFHPFRIAQNTRSRHPAQHIDKSVVHQVNIFCQILFP